VSHNRNEKRRIKHETTLYYNAVLLIFWVTSELRERIGRCLADVKISITKGKNNKNHETKEQYSIKLNFKVGSMPIKAGIPKNRKEKNKNSKEQQTKKIKEDL
jgi:hypothetical protein